MTVPAAVLARVTPAMDRIYTRPLSDDPERAARQTMTAINALIRDGAADPIVRQQAAAIVAEADARTPAAVLDAVHAWVQRHMPYVRDPSPIELLTSARAAIDSIAQQGSYVEDCDGQVIVEASLLRALLGPAAVQTVIIKADRRAPTLWSHIFLQARVNGRWVTLDPIMNGGDPKRPKKPVGWHPPRFFAREAVPVGDGPGLQVLAAVQGMAAYERGGSMANDWIPASRDRGNAMAAENDSWFDALPELPNHPAADVPGLAGAAATARRGGFGAVMSNVYAQQTNRFNGLGAITSHGYAQGPTPGYRPTTVGEDPYVATGTPYWGAPGTVGGTVRALGLKTTALSGIADYVQLQGVGGFGDMADLAKVIVEQAAGITTLAQLQQLNATRAQSGLPPIQPGQVGIGPNQAAVAPMDGTTMLMLVGGAAVIGAAILWGMSRRRR